MKLVQSFIVAAALTIPAVSSFAQANQDLTRAAVRAQLVQLEKAGYQPASDQTQYPLNIQAAQARVDANKGGVNDVGGVGDGTSLSGGSIAQRTAHAAIAHVNEKVKGPVRLDGNSGMEPIYFGS